LGSRPAAAAVPDLVRSLRSEAAWIRVAAASALEVLGPIARPALGALREAQRDDADATVRQRAGDAIERITVESEAPYG
jgi:hypothetical protein